MTSHELSEREIYNAVLENTKYLPGTIAEILGNRATLATEAGRYQIVDSLDNAELTINAGRLPRWEHHPVSEQLQPRGDSEPIYMYLYWRFDRYTRRYNSPNGNRKTYVGNKPARQSLARSLDANLHKWEALTRAMNNHSYELDRVLGGLSTASNRARSLVNAMDATIEEFTAEIAKRTPEGA